MLIVYATHITPRLQYVVATLFQQSCTLTSEQNVFTGFEGIRINYSDTNIAGSHLQIYPVSLLFESDCKAQPVSCTEWNGLKIFFPTNGTIPFDIFAASFYLISRYEEYLPHRKDAYGRYDHTNSLAHQACFLHLPLVQLWMNAFDKIIQSVCPGYSPAKNKFQWIPTYDIDIAYAYQHQPVLKNIAGFFRDLLRMDFDKVRERSMVYSGSAADPFDTYAWLDQLHQLADLQPVYFFLVAARRQGFDKNINPRSKAMQSLIRQHAKQYCIGLHPSVQSTGKYAKLIEEKQLLEQYIGRPVLHSRQHYLKLLLPDTFHDLLNAGIQEEYSMGYGSANGFRASYALPYYWYDLTNEKTTSLRIHPFCFMDSTAFFQERLTAEEAITSFHTYFQTVASVQGEFISIFHNHMLTLQPEWTAWREQLEMLFQQYKHAIS